ncbi:hypothetical protein GCM10027417_25190 [Glutamicibacter endophyticus]
MSTSTVTPPRAGRVTLGSVFRAESIRFFALRSTQILIVVAVLAQVALAALGIWSVGAFMSNIPAEAGMPNFTDPEVTAEVFGSGITFSQLILGAMAVLLASGEFTTGSAVSTFLASPQRLRVLSAKALLIAVLTGAISVLGTLLAYLVCLPIAGHYELGLELSSAAFQRVLWYGALTTMMVALIGLALGFLLRSSAGGITVLLGLFFVLSILVQVLIMAVDWVKNIVQYLPDQVVSALISPTTSMSSLETWQLMCAVAGWAVIPLVFAAWALRARDI